MKTKSFRFILAFIVLGISTIFILSNSKSDREKYENFLLNDINSINIKYESDEMGLHDKPELAGIQDYYATIDPKLKRVPHERLVKTISGIKNYKDSKSALYDRYQWIEVPSDMGGRARSFMVDPNDSEHKKVWAGSVTGGLWYNNNIYDDRSSWVPVSDLWDNLSISSITYDPNNSNIFYVGTGEPQTAVTIYRESSTRGVGVWKTSDAGTTWVLLPGTSDFAYITDIIVRNEEGTSVIYAGVASGVYQGEDHSSAPSDGLYRSTDGGTTWTQVLPTINGETDPYTPSDIELAASGRIFVGTYRNINGKGGASILYSDDGLSWNIFDDYVAIIEASEGGVLVDDNSRKSYACFSTFCSQYYLCDYCSRCIYA